MKKLTGLLIIGAIAFTSCKQEVKTPEVTKATEMVKEVVKEMAKVQSVSLEQVPGEFVQKELTLEAGTYVFNIANKNVDHEVGFVLAPKGKTDAANHIKAAYVTSPVATGSSSKTKEVVLAKGEYVYFCPLNPTPQYNLTVK